MALQLFPHSQTDPIDPATRRRIRAGTFVAALGIGAALAAAPTAEATTDDTSGSSASSESGNERSEPDREVRDDPDRDESEKDPHAVDDNSNGDDDDGPERPTIPSSTSPDDDDDEAEEPEDDSPTTQRRSASPRSSGLDRALDDEQTLEPERTLQSAETAPKTTLLTAATTVQTTATVVIPPKPPAKPTTVWSLLESWSQQFRRIFSNTTPAIGYNATDNRVRANTDNITGTIDFTDPDGDRLEVTVSAPEHGRVTVNPDGSFVYDPVDGYVGRDSFVVTASDAADPRFHGLLGFLIRNRGLTATRVIDIAVSAAATNRAPLLGSPAFVIDGIDSATGEVTGTVKVTDPDGDPLAYTSAGGPAHAQGTVRIDAATARWSFTPTAAARQQALAAGRPLDTTFAVTATDGRNASVTVPVTVAITAVAATAANVPTAPAAPAVTPAATSVTVSWTQPGSGGSSITRYSVRYRPLGGSWSLAPDVAGSALSTTITGLLENTDYEIALRASNAVGNSAWSASRLTHTSGEIVDPGPDPGTPPSGNVLWSDRFDTAPNGQLTKVTGDALFGPTGALTSGGTYVHGSIQTDPDGGKLLRHAIPAGQLGAFIVAPKLIRPTDHAVLSYDVRFDDNFDWRWGGKIPGLVGVAPGHSIYEPTSGNADRSVGFSARLMWHGRGDDGTRPFQGKLGPIQAGADMDLVTYIYARQPSAGFNGFGWHTSLGNAFGRGQWHRVTMEVQLNTVGARDGVFKVWVDDTLRYSAPDWIYRDRPDVMIEAVLYDIHRGGGTTPPSWVSTRDTHVDIRNMTVTEL